MSNPELFSNSNYHLYALTPSGTCDVLTTVSVTIKVLEDIVTVPVAPSVAGEQSNGVSFQFNCSPLTTQHASTWQQYVMSISRTGQELSWSINNFRPGDSASDPSINLGDTMVAIQSDLPAGYARIPLNYTLKIELQAGRHGIVTGVKYSAFDEKNQPLCPPVNIALTQHLDKNKNQITVADLAAIADVTLDIVGYANGAQTLLTSGSGTITYQVDQSLITAAGSPECVYSNGTAESSNVTYGELPAGPSKTFTQTFGYEPGSSYIAVQIPGHALNCYRKTIGSTFWLPEFVAPEGTTFSAPSLAQVGNSSCIVAQGPENSLKFYWQTIDVRHWHPETVAWSATEQPGSLAAGPPLAPPGC